MAQAHLPLSNHLERQEISLPKLPNWASFKSPLLDEIIATVSTLPNEILQDDTKMVQSCAYFVIAALSDVHKKSKYSDTGKDLSNLGPIKISKPSRQYFMD